MKSIVTATIFSAILLLGACRQTTVDGPAGAPAGAIVSTSRGATLTATLTNSTGYLREGQNEFTLDFKKSDGQLVDVGAITLIFDMPQMGSMPYMKNEATLTTTTTPGVYRGTVTIDMKGTWQSKLTYLGPAGNEQVTFTVNVR